MANIIWVWLVKHWHDLNDGHILTGWNVAHMDELAYPYCSVCGARPKEGFIFKWYDKRYLDLRAKFGREEWDNISSSAKKSKLEEAGLKMK